MQFNPKIGFYLGILVTIEIAVSSGTLSLTHAIAPDWIPTVTAWAGILAFGGSTILTFLHGYSSGQPGPLVGVPPAPATKLAAAIGALVLLATLLAPGDARAQNTRQPTPRPTQEAAAPAPAAAATHTTTHGFPCDPLNFLPGCTVDVPSADGKGTSTKPVELDIWQKIVNAALPDLDYASQLAQTAGTPGAGVRKQCWDALITANKQASGTGIKDAAGNVIAKPDPHLFTDVESLAELLDNLAPKGPLWTACAGAAQLAGTSVLTFINAAVTGAAGLAALGVT